MVEDSRMKTDTEIKAEMKTEADLKAYGGFARGYDLFMDETPYEEWCMSIRSILKQYGILDGLILDLGCGTGKMTRLLRQAGYDMIGVDSSEEMLGIAMEHQEDAGILYLHQDMREFELYGTVRAVISVCDSMNYMLEEDELLAVFSLVNNYLDPGGIFLFDMNTLYKYREILGEQTICENREEGSFIWENYFDEETQINQYDMTFFIREADGRYQKFEETHFQRGYAPDKIKELAERAGLEWIGCYEAYTNQPFNIQSKVQSERILAVVRERGKKGEK